MLQSLLTYVGSVYKNEREIAPQLRLEDDVSHNKFFNLFSKTNLLSRNKFQIRFLYTEKQTKFG